MENTAELSYALLAATSLFCLYQTPGPFSKNAMAFIAYGGTGLSAICTLLRTQTDGDNELLRKLDVYLWYIETISFPLLVGNLWLKYGYEMPIGIAHPVGVVLKSGANFLDDITNNGLLLGYTLTEISCGYLGYIKHNQNAIISALTFLASGVIRKSDNSYNLELYNLGIASTYYFMLVAAKAATLF